MVLMKKCYARIMLKANFRADSGLKSGSETLMYVKNTTTKKSEMRLMIQNNKRSNLLKENIFLTAYKG